MTPKDLKKPEFRHKPEHFHPLHHRTPLAARGDLLHQTNPTKILEMVSY